MTSNPLGWPPIGAVEQGRGDDEEAAIEPEWSYND
jgi:hypothetical protein